MKVKTKYSKYEEEIMYNWGTIFNGVLLGVGGLVGFLFGGWFVLLQILLAFMAIDYFTGVAAGFIEGKLSSKVGFKGIAKKVIILFVVAAAHLLDLMFSTGQVIRDGAIFFYIGNELLSFVENVGKTGLPVPKKIVNAVDVLKGKGDGQ
jgi:toxin secretion/phage lysis holin